MQEFLSSIFGSVYLSGGDGEAEALVTGGLPVEQALCLPVSSEELLQAPTQFSQVTLSSALLHCSQCIDLYAMHSYTV